jgi:hypothetical protein
MATSAVNGVRFDILEAKGVDLIQNHSIDGNFQPFMLENARQE